MRFNINRFDWIVSLVAAAALTGPLLALSKVELLRTPNEEPIPDLSVATAIALPAGYFQVIY